MNNLSKEELIQLAELCGKKTIKWDTKKQHWHWNRYGMREVWRPDKKIKQAMEVLDFFEYSHLTSDSSLGCTCMLNQGRSNYDEELSRRKAWSGWQDSRALAICKAALKAINGEVGE